MAKTLHVCCYNLKNKNRTAGGRNTVPLQCGSASHNCLEHCPSSFPLNSEDRLCPTGSGQSTEHPSLHPDPKDPENYSWEPNSVYTCLTAHPGRPQWAEFSLKRF